MSLRRTNGLLLVVALVSAIGLLACGDDDGGGGTTPPPPPAGDSATPPSGDPTFTSVYTGIIQPGCSCHLAPAGAGGLVMSDQATAYTNLVGAASSGGGMCPGATRVAPGDPAGSVLYRKVSGENLCGARMPRGMSPLSSAQIDLIQRWIMAGANND